MEKTKKFVNDVTTCVDENLEGLLALNPGLRKVKGHKVIVRSDLDEYANAGKVAVLTGGGSGHEPAFSGYVGHGMATGCVLGSIFASPSPTDIIAGIQALAVNNTAGVIMLFNNYTGDRLTFGIAAERARAQGVRVTMVINADDCAVLSSDKTAGRRGLAGLVPLIKIAGALAEAGKPLEDVTETTAKASRMIGTLGICLNPCSLPGMGPLFKVGPDKMELGLGLHGEAGVRTVQLMSAHDTVVTMLDHIMDPDNKIHLSVKEGDELALLLNNLGATSDMEMNIVANEAIKYLESKNIRVTRAYMNRFATSQEMAGMSITLLLLNEDFKRCLDSETHALAWLSPISHKGSKERIPAEELGLCPKTSAHMLEASRGPVVSEEKALFTERAVRRICESLMAARERLNQLDSGCGDGDCGSTLWNGAKAILDSLEQNELACGAPRSLLLQVASLVEAAMGGSSGALYSLFFTAAAQQLTEDSRAAWVAAFKAGLDAVKKYGGAEVGDRTMVDPLQAAHSALEESLQSGDVAKVMASAANAAQTAAQATATMTARAGRASYVGAEHLGEPDAGAWAVAVALVALQEATTNTTTAAASCSSE